MPHAFVTNIKSSLIVESEAPLQAARVRQYRQQGSLKSNRRQQRKFLRSWHALLQSFHWHIQRPSGQRFRFLDGEGKREVGGVSTKRISVLGSAAALGCCCVIARVVEHSDVSVGCVGGEVKSSWTPATLKFKHGSSRSRGMIADCLE